MATHFSILAWRIPMDRGLWWVAKPLSLGFSRQEYWSGVPLPSPVATFYLLPKTSEPKNAGMVTMQPTAERQV